LDVTWVGFLFVDFTRFLKASGTPNPFFGTRSIKKSTPVHVKDDFNPFKHNKVVDASHVCACRDYFIFIYRRGLTFSCVSRYLAIQRQALHADVPTTSTPSCATWRAHAATCPDPHASSIVRRRLRGPGCSTATPRLCLLSAIWIPASSPSSLCYFHGVLCLSLFFQHMMPGMPPPGPPGAYMPGPYMQHMPYPPGMPPPNGVYLLRVLFYSVHFLTANNL